MKITVYTTHSCPYCQMAKDLLRKKGLDFEEVDVSEDTDFDALLARTGWKTVPQIFFDEKLIGGYRELSRLDAEGKLNAFNTNGHSV